MSTGPVYGVQVEPPDSDHSIRSTPLVESVELSDTGIACACQPSSFAGANAAVVAGAVASTLNVSERAASTLPALSTDRYDSACVPSAEIVTGAV